MNDETAEALAGIKSAWKNMLTAEDRKTYEFWRDEQLRIQKILYEERKRTLSRLYRNEHANDGAGKSQIQKYQHEYYLRVTKIKRAERRKNR